MSDTTVKERRAHERHDTNLTLQWTTQTPGAPGDEGAVARMVARNLSVGGLYCTSTTDFPEMTRLEVRLMLPVSDRAEAAIEALDLEAIVVRREELASAVGHERYELALFFTNLKDAYRQRIERYLSE